MRLRRPDLVAAFLLLAGGSARAEDAPKLPETAASAEAFAPAGWTVEAKTFGDLDGDRRADVAFVLRRSETDPRVFVVAKRAGKGFRLIAENATLIPRPPIGDAPDALAPTDFGILRRSLRVGLTKPPPGGNLGFEFRLRGRSLELVGYERVDFHRDSGETETLIVDYASGRVSRSQGTIDGDARKEKKILSKAPARRGPTIETIGDGLAFDPLK